MAIACVWYLGLLSSKENSKSTILTATCTRLEPAKAKEFIPHDASSDGSLDDYALGEEIRGYQAGSTFITYASLNWA